MDGRKGIVPEEPRHLMLRVYFFLILLCFFQGYDLANENYSLTNDEVSVEICETKAENSSALEKIFMKSKRS